MDLSAIFLKEVQMKIRIALRYFDLRGTGLKKLTSGHGFQTGKICVYRATRGESFEIKVVRTAKFRATLSKNLIFKYEEKNFLKWRLRRDIPWRELYRLEDLKYLSSNLSNKRRIYKDIFKIGSIDNCIRR